MSQKGNDARMEGVGVTDSYQRQRGGEGDYWMGAVLTVDCTNTNFLVKINLLVLNKRRRVLV